MRLISHESYLHQIGWDVRRELVRSAVGDPRAALVAWREKLITGGASGSEIYAVSGEAESGGVNVPWRFILKMINHEGEGWQECSTDPLAWDYWKREWLLYQAPWVRTLSEGLVTPRCLGSGELGDTAAWLALEDLSQHDDRPWPQARFAVAARHLGHFNGRFSGGSVPTDPWLSRDWLRRWTGRADAAIRQLPGLVGHPTMAKLYPPSHLTLLLQVWHRRQEVYQVLDRLPHTICHQDLFPRNAFVRSEAGVERTLAIDWAFCGSAPVGADLAPLVGASLSFFELDADHADEVERLCLDAHHEGLSEAGWAGSRDDIVFGYLGTLVLRFMIGTVRPLLATVLEDNPTELVEQIFGHPMPVLIDRWSSLIPFREARMHALLDRLNS